MSIERTNTRLIRHHVRASRQSRFTQESGRDGARKAGGRRARRYGIIYRAWDRTLRRIVALKRLLPHNESQDGFPLTSLREVATLRKLRGHANVVTFLGVAVGHRRDAVFLVLEFAEHGDLGSLLDNRNLRRGRGPLFGEAETKCLSRQLLLALRHCHERYICHRDVKVANLLSVRPRGRFADEIAATPRPRDAEIPRSRRRRGRATWLFRGDARRGRDADIRRDRVAGTPRAASSRSATLASRASCRRGGRAATARRPSTS